MDVVHSRVGHGATLMVVGQQPLNHGTLAASRAEVDGVAASVTGHVARSRDAGTRAAGRDDLHGAELLLDAREQAACGSAQTGA